jgi:hypothetical protein
MKGLSHGWWHRGRLGVPKASVLRGPSSPSLQNTSPNSITSPTRIAQRQRSSSMALRPLYNHLFHRLQSR